MSSSDERNFLPLVAIVIVIVFTGAIVAGVVVWRRMPTITYAHVASTAPSVTVMPTPTMIAPTPTATFTTPAPFADLDDDDDDDDVKPPPVPTATHVAPPTATAGGTSEIPNAARTLARLRSQLKFCYEQGLMKDPSLSGSIVIAAVVSPSGEVTSASKKSGGINADVDACLLRRVKSASFDATPSGGTINIPLHFQQAGF